MTPSLYPIRLGLQPGSAGQPISVITNSFAVTTLPKDSFVHYDEFPGFDRPLKRERALIIIDRLQTQEAAMFNPRAAYDGKRNMFRSIALNLPNNGAIFKVFMGESRPSAHNNVKGVDVKITRVAVIDPRSITAVLKGQGAHSSQSQTAMTLFNVLIRMKPIMSYPSNARSFFTNDIRKDLGAGLELWRGLFQSVRPTLNRLLINVDIATAVMYSSGLLIDLIIKFMGCRDARDLVPTHLNPAMQKRLTQFVKNLAVWATVPPPRQGKTPRFRRIAKIVLIGADQYQFSNDKTGQTMTITDHFLKAHNFRVKFGNIICVDVGKGIVYPLEVLKVKEGQMYKKTLPSALAPQALKFSTLRPNERILAIQRGAGLLGYAESDYLRQSGMTIDQHLISVKGRVLAAPSIQWGGNQRPDAPRGGAWNVLGKQLYKPGHVKAWSVVVYETRLDQHSVEKFLRDFVNACKALGIAFPSEFPEIIQGRPQGGEKNHYDDMEKAGLAAINRFQGSSRPTFILVILPDSAIDIRTSVKSWGDCIRGCPTQCMKREKLLKANNQYCNNLALKVNTKIGGVNSVPSTHVPTMQWLSEKPTMVIGADVSHAAPDSDRPSITGLVSSVDEHFCQYVASCNVQTAREEIIADLPAMIENAIMNFSMFWTVMRGRKNVVPQRIIFYRDGVSESEFQEVGTKEVNEIKVCLAKLWKEKRLSGEPPKITFIIVAKRHHVRFFPKEKKDEDRSGNCPPGLVIDQEIANPVDYDFYLQSHGGLLGTSRPGHYSVIEDGNGLDSDKLQEISYTLCHVYARATRSVSIPAPVYYADIVCARGRFHSKLIHDGSDQSTVSGEVSLEDHRKAFNRIAENMKTSMYFM